MKPRRVRSGEIEDKIFERVTYLCRYLHSPLSDVLALTARQAEMFEAKLGTIVSMENGKK